MTFQVNLANMILMDKSQQPNPQISVPSSVSQAKEYLKYVFAFVCMWFLKEKQLGGGATIWIVSPGPIVLMKIPLQSDYLPQPLLVSVGGESQSGPQCRGIKHPSIYSMFLIQIRFPNQFHFKHKYGCTRRHLMMPLTDAKQKSHIARMLYKHFVKL